MTNGFEPQISTTTPEESYREACKWLVTGDRDLAERYARRVLTSNSEHSGAQQILAAITQARVREEATGDEEVRFAVEERQRRRQWVDMYYQHALLLLAQNETKEARYLLDEAMRLMPDHRGVRRLLSHFPPEPVPPPAASPPPPPAPTPIPVPEPAPERSTTRDLRVFLSSLVISVIVTYGIVWLFGTILTTTWQEIPLAFLFCGWLFIPIFILTLGAVSGSSKKKKA